MRIKDARQTFLGIWIKNLLQGKPIQVFGDGKQRRDYNFIDDVIDALVLAAISDSAIGKAFNLGGPDSLSLEVTAKLMCNLIEDSSYEMISFPKDRKAIDVGDFVSDYTAFSNAFGWNPKISFESGISKSIDFFQGRDRILSLSYLSMIPFSDPSASYKAHKKEINLAIQRVLDSGWFVLGKEVKLFEEEFAAFHGGKFYAVGVANGTDAIALSLQSLGLAKRR